MDRKRSIIEGFARDVVPVNISTSERERNPNTTDNVSNDDMLVQDELEDDDMRGIEASAIHAGRYLETDNSNLTKLD